MNRLAKTLEKLSPRLIRLAPVLCGLLALHCASALELLPWSASSPRALRAAAEARLGADEERLARATALAIRLRTLYVAAAHGVYNAEDRRNFRRLEAALSADLARLRATGPNDPALVTPPSPSATAGLSGAEANAGIAAMDACLEELIAERLRVRTELERSRAAAPPAD